MFNRLEEPSQARAWPERSKIGRSPNRIPGQSGCLLGCFVAIVGTQRVPDSGYFKAKLAQEQLIAASGLPHTLVHATQFFEFVGAIVQGATVGSEVHVPPAFIQPVASADVATFLADIALAEPSNGSVHLAGPDKLTFQDIARLYLDANNDPRDVTAPADARYFGAHLPEDALVPIHEPAKLGGRHYRDWLQQGSK